MRLRHLVILTLIAVTAALPRFGDRENPAAQASDSDYYLDTLEVFSGEKEAFDPIASAPGSSGSKHYARPLLALLATPPAHWGVPREIALSAVSLISAWAIAVGLYLLLRGVPEAGRLAWLVPALFLTGFPQVNWGYHILSDSLGYATAFLASLATWAFLVRYGAERFRGSDPRMILALAGIGLLQTAAFLARETAWFAVVVLVFLAAWERRWKTQGPVITALLAVLLLAKLPHSIYVASFGLESVQIPFAPMAWLDSGYVLDFLTKSAIAFHMAWLLALVGLRVRGLRSVPPLLLGWSMAALLYIAAGYAANSREGIGYPLRMTYALFPLVYFLCVCAVNSRLTQPRRRIVVAALLIVVNALVSGIGVALDPGTSLVLAPRASSSVPVTSLAGPCAVESVFCVESDDAQPIGEVCRSRAKQHGRG